MANAPITRWRTGKVTASLWQGEWEGKPTYSISIQKDYKSKSGEWKHTNFFTFADLRDVLALVMHIVNINIKSEKVEPKPAPEDPQEEAASEEVPW